MLGRAAGRMDQKEKMREKRVAPPVFWVLSQSRETSMRKRDVDDPVKGDKVNKKPTASPVGN